MKRIVCWRIRHLLGRNASRPRDVRMRQPRSHPMPSPWLPARRPPLLHCHPLVRLSNRSQWNSLLGYNINAATLGPIKFLSGTVKRKGNYKNFSGGQFTEKINFTSWWHRSGSTLAQVVACCLTAPSHYLNQCWLVITKVQWCSCEGNFAWDIAAISH